MVRDQSQAGNMLGLFSGLKDFVPIGKKVLQVYKYCFLTLLPLDREA